MRLYCGTQRDTSLPNGGQDTRSLAHYLGRELAEHGPVDCAGARSSGATSHGPPERPWPRTGDGAARVATCKQSLPLRNAYRSKSNLSDAVVGILCTLKINAEKCEPRHTG